MMFHDDFCRALQLHPHVPALYILAASHELSHLSPSAARVLMQRGIRMNAESAEMWTEYVKFEVGFVESMRRRWDVLGINSGGKGKDKEKPQGVVVEGMDEVEVEQMQTEADGEGDEAELARREIMKGAIVKSVMSNAAKGALPSTSLLCKYLTEFHQLCPRRNYSHPFILCCLLTPQHPPSESYSFNTCTSSSSKHSPMTRLLCGLLLRESLRPT